MEGGASGSSWHPALMPNSAAAVVEHSAASATDHSKATPEAIDSTPAPGGADPPAAAEGAEVDNDIGDAWLVDEDAGDVADAWLVSQDTTAEEAMPPSSTEPPELIEAPSEVVSIPTETETEVKPEDANLQTPSQPLDALQSTTDQVDPYNAWLASDETAPSVHDAKPTEPSMAMLEDSAVANADHTSDLTMEKAWGAEDPAAERTEPTDVEGASAWLHAGGTVEGPTETAKVVTQDTEPSNAWTASDQPLETPEHKARVPADEDGDTSASTRGPEPLQSEEIHEASEKAPTSIALDFTDDGDNADAWLTSNDSAHVAEQAQPEYATGTQETEQHQPSDRDESKSQSNAQHSSSMSFARTVSHEISFNDDDDGDWNLTRSDTDPFKFMPPSDRTNSFPVVPPAHAQGDHPPDEPLPRAQALDALEEADKDDMEALDAEAAAQEPKMFWDQEDQPNKPSHGASQSVGGAVGDASMDASEARYEEGLPLIPRATEEKTQDLDDKSAAPATFESSFIDDDGDDFFSKIPQTGEETEKLSPVERKSTMHFLQSIASEQGQDLENSEENTPAAAGGSGNNRNEQPAEDLASKWQEAFGGDDDEDFLLDEQQTGKQDFDAAGFLGSDDEGLLEDDDVPSSAPQQSAAANQAPAPNPYAPTGLSNIPPAPAQVSQFGYASAPPSFSQANSYAPNTQSRPAAPKTESFADKSKGGYSSPYDLPTDLVSMNIKPRKRASMQQLAQEQLTTQPPPRSVSGYTPGQGPPSAPPTTNPGQQPPAPKPLGRSGSSFFEDLPVAAKPRPSSRQSARAPSPAKQYGPPQSAVPPAGPPINMDTDMRRESSASDSYYAQGSAPTPIENLVAPAKVNPYASIQPAAQAPPPSGSATRYSPAPAQQMKSGSAPPPAVANRFSPAPPTRQNSSQSPPAHASASQTYLPHLPRTSSPLAQFEVHSGKGGSLGHDAAPSDRRASFAYEPKLNRVSSLPPTREVDEEEDEPLGGQGPAHPATAVPRYSPATSRPDSTPPPSSGAYQTSPQKRTGSNYAPQPAPSSHLYSAPPPRAQTQSPGAVRNVQSAQDQDATARSLSVNPSASMAAPHAQTYSPAVRQRGPSLSMNLVPPTDGREHDPLKRWQGVPIISWGVGGTMVTSFPKSIPRYSMNQTTPTMLRASGEVKVKSIKDIEPLDEHLAKFPGPLRGKSKKKDALMWLAAGIDKLEKDLPDISLQHLSLEAKRSIERILLWKLLRVFVEFDGHLEGTAAVDKAVQDILIPKELSATNGDAMLPSDRSLGAGQSSLTAMQADSVDSASMEQIRRDLLKGDREAAVWTAVDKRLWGHAMLISQTISPDLYKRVAQEFVRKEVNYPGHSNESLGAFYKVLSGNFDDCVDELVPVHARAGLQLMSTEAPTGSTRDVMDGLDKWRETVSLVLSNRSQDDVQGLRSLGKLLSSYGRAEAAQICFLFSRGISVFGGLDDPNADFVLLGADHNKQSDQFAKETEALQLSEVYEYGLTLSGAVNFAAGAPHLAAYKLQHAIVLAEYGHRDQALQYCDAIIAAITAQTRRSPYHHSILEGAVDDFMRRLKQAPKEEVAGWMSKPNMNKVSDSMWNRFNKFVSGDEDKDGGHGDGEQGPFARIASTPNLSRSPSVSNFESYGGGSPNYAASTVPPPMPSTASSRYAPAVNAATAAQNPHDYGMQKNYAPQPASTGRSSNEYAASPYEPNYGVSNNATGEYTGFNSFEPAQRAPSGGYGDHASPYQPQTQSGGGYQPQQLQESPSIVPAPAAQQSNDYPGFQPSSYAPAPATLVGEGASIETSEDAGGFQPPSMQPYSYEPPGMQATFEPPETQSTGYEPPVTQSYGYEPPSYNPAADQTAQDEATQPKKKSFMDDDEDDIPGLKPPTKSQADLDRENQEMFRKAAEEDAKRAAEQQHGKKGWGFGGWFGGAKKTDIPTTGSTSDLNKPTRAKLGEANSFVYDPELKRWINKKAGAEQVEASKPTPPPPRGGAPRSVSGTPPPGGAPSPGGPPRSVSASTMPPSSAPPQVGGPVGGTPPMARSASNLSSAAAPTPPSGPPSRPTTSMSNASSIDDLLGAPAPRKAGQKKPRKSGRYVDVMAQ